MEIHGSAVTPTQMADIITDLEVENQQNRQALDNLRQRIVSDEERIQEFQNQRQQMVVQQIQQSAVLQDDCYFHTGRAVEISIRYVQSIFSSIIDCVFPKIRR